MKIKVLVVDDNVGLVGLIKEYFSGSDKIEIVKSVSNGEDAIKILSENKLDFDIMLLDLVMPVKDGISVLHYMKENNIKRKVIVMTSYNEEQTIRDVSEYGVRYYCLKPFDLEDLKNKIIQTITYKKNNDKIIEIENKDIQIQVTKLLHALGIPSHIKGYQFIRSAILMVYENPGLIGGITKELYPDLSIKFNTSTQRVERAIRHAIEVSWLRGDIDLMEEIFGHSVDIDRAKPTNSEFIVTIADKLRLEMINVA
jgi:two-component system response regulator (stage 0 sporulation protein A)